jgi:integrase/recombinase XerD
MNFRQYLERAGLAKSNFRRMEILAEGWLVWLSSRQIELAATTYADLLDYVGHLQKQGKSRYVINRTLQTISHYYRFQQLPDIAFGVRLRGVTQTAVGKLLTVEQLTELYEGFEVKQDKGYYHHSDKLILGLMIFQGLEMGEIERLELHDLDLEKGVINAPAGRLRLTRKIPLQGVQILPWRRFVEEVRPGLITERSDKLLAPQADKRQRLHHQLKRLSKRVKAQAKAGPGLTINKLNQLRQSRIAIWVESYGLRKAQYLSGLRQLLSVERYQKRRLEDLQRQIGQHHPLQ